MGPNIPVQKLPDDEVAYKQIKGVDDYNKTIKCTYFLVVLFKEGSGTHYIDEKEFPIGSHQLHFLFPGQHHHWVTSAETFAYKIVVGKKIFESFSDTDEFHFIRHNLNPVLKLSDKLFDVVTMEMESIERDLQHIRTNPYWSSIIRLRMDILASIMRGESESHLKQALLSKSNPVVKEFWRMVSQNYSEKKAPSWYASQLSVTPNYLNILCRKHLNITATDIIHQKIMQEAKKALRFSEKSIKQLSLDLGFENLPAFSGFFKKKSGFSPSEYRDL